MKRLLLLFLYYCSATQAQEVKPVLSKAYLDLIHRDPSVVPKPDHGDSVKPLLYTHYNRVFYPAGTFANGQIWRMPARIAVRNQELTIYPEKTRVINFGGNLTASVAVRRVNRVPALQNEYVQGRSENNALVWRGAETNELFSYGPAVAALQFDQSNYAYDVNGRLTEAGTGNGKAAVGYDNKLFRTAAMFSQAAVIRGKCLVNGDAVVAGMLKFGRDRERTWLPQHKNNNDHLSGTLDVMLNKVYTLSGGYSREEQILSNSNRSGFLNRVYQQSLLTPVSFDNQQGYVLGNAQRRYSDQGDNPWFLLSDNGNASRQLEQFARMGIEKKVYKVFKWKMQASREIHEKSTLENYKAGTAGYVTGASIAREQRDNNWFFKGNATYDIKYGNAIGSVAAINANMEDNTTNISYANGPSYHYQRSVYAGSANYQTTFTWYRYKALLNVVNRMYTSNTAMRSDLWQPGVSVALIKDGWPGLNRMWVKLKGNYAEFVSEPSLARSLAGNHLLRLTAAQASQYFPVQEVQGYDGLKPVLRREWTAGIDMWYANWFGLSAELFRRTIRNDVFPTFNNGVLSFMNLAHHRSDGIEVVLSFQSSGRKRSFRSTLSLIAYNNKVTGLLQGYDTLAISGFADVRKVAVPGKPLGAIAGSRFLRNDKGEVMISADGYPLVDPVQGIVGNPIPDFVIKSSHEFTWKRFVMNLDAEWKKGGDVWNGTQAVLDYYGRSKTSGQLRNTSGYVFHGIRQDGQKNEIPVTFYDVSKPFADNRWVRYGYSGVTEAYIQRGDYVRINNVSLSYRLPLFNNRRSLTLTGYAGNILVWTPYEGADPSQLLFDMPQTEGLDLFNLPSAATYGVSVSFQF